MARSRIGPLALEAPLGGAGSHVFRAFHVQQKVQLAVRVFSVPMGMTPEAKRDFTQQMEELKALRHPGIVRCYGGGFDQRDAYLVYELVDGESLDSILERRQRLPWESVLEYGQQLCNALQVAHDTKRVHGHLLPNKLLVTRDGSQIKISDFRNDRSLGGLILRPLSVHELPFMAPEALDGQTSVAADLYSIGACLYQMLTGKAPFQATDVQKMRQQIATERVPPVATLVFDCPVWLNAIVEQLLEKDPESRPFSAAAVGMALGEAHLRASQGTSVVQHAVSGFSPLQMKSADRNEAEKLLGKKKKKQKSRQEEGPAIYERAWFLILCLAIAVAGIVYLLLPPNEKQLRQRAEKLLATNEPVDWNDARDRYLQMLIDRFPDSENADWAHEQIEIIEMKNAERKIERNARIGREPGSEAEKRYIEANRYERFGDRVTALDKYTAIVNLRKEIEEERPYVNLARRQIKQIQESPPSADELRKFLENKLQEANTFSEKGDAIEARKIWDSILSLYKGNRELQAIVEQAQNKIDQAQDSE